MNLYPNFHDMEHLSGITWQDLVELEPRLGELLWKARQAGASCLSWSDVDWVFSPVRNSIFDLVGFTSVNRRHRVLGSTGAYEVAYWKLYDAVAGLLPRNAPGAVEAPEKQGGEPVGEASRTQAVA
jgi:hypothetical protein